MREIEFQESNYNKINEYFYNLANTKKPSEISKYRNESIKIKIIFDFMQYFKLHNSYTFLIREDNKICVKSNNKTYFIVSSMKIKKIELAKVPKCFVYLFDCVLCFENFIRSDFKSKSEPSTVIYNYIPSKTEMEMIIYCESLEDEDFDYFWELSQIEKSSVFGEENEEENSTPQKLISRELIDEKFEEIALTTIVIDDMTTITEQIMNSMMIREFERYREINVEFFHGGLIFVV